MTAKKDAQSAKNADVRAKDDSCPNCGACKECGAGGVKFIPYPMPYPVYPPPVAPYRPPANPWITQPLTWGQGNTAVSGITFTSNASGNYSA